MKKNRSSFEKPRRSKSSMKRLQRKQRKAQSSSEFVYENLEPRYALDASFGFDDGNLNLFGFSSNVVVSGAGNSITAVLPNGSWSTADPDDLPDNVTFEGSNLTVEGGLGSITANLGGNELTFGESNFNQPFVITNAGLINQVERVDLASISISGPGDVLLAEEFFDDEGNIVLNRIDNVDINVDGEALVSSETSIDGIDFIGSNVSITSLDDLNLGAVGGPNTTFVDIDAASITATSVTTIFTSVAGDINQLGADPVSSVRLRATGGEVLTGILDDQGNLISDTPIARDNTAGGISISGGIVSDQVLLQSSNGINIPIDGLDTLYLFLGGDFESESRGEYQLNVPSLQELSTSLYDGFSITSQQDLTIGNFEFTGPSPFLFTNGFSDLYANITATSLTFDAPFQSQKLVADITVDIAQNPGADLTIDDLYVSGESVILDNTNNDFQRIAAVGQGFLADDRQNNEDILTIRDQGTLEIAVLDNLPDDPFLVNFATPISRATLEGINVAGQVDILTGLGSPIPTAPVGAVEPSFEQLGNTLFGNEDFRIERFEIPRDRSGTQTGVFRDDNYNGAVRPVYYIEFIYNGTQDLVIQTDAFERGNPEPVRNFIDIELGLYNEFGELVAIGQELTGQLDEIAFGAGTLAPGRYFVAASAFSSEFEDDFVVRTSNVQTGTLNVTITGNDPVTPVLSRDLTQAVGASLIVQGGEEPIPADQLASIDPNAFSPEVLVQLDPNAQDFVPPPTAVDEIGDPLPETDGRAILGALNGGTVQLGQIDTNDIRELIISEAGAVEFANVDDLVVSSLDVSGDSRLAAGRGGEGQLTVGDVDSSSLLLQAASGVSQEGAITTDLLLLGGSTPIEGGGDFVILSDTLENAAFSLPAGNLALTTSQELNLLAVQFADIIGDPFTPTPPPSLTSISSQVSGTARIEAASLNVNTLLQAETLVLDVENAITQTVSAAPLNGTNPLASLSIGSIVAQNLSVSATTVDLDGSANQFSRLAGDVSGTLDLVNLDPVVFATIDNTVETSTRLRPLGVTQTFEPLTTISGLTAGTANITSGSDGDLALGAIGSTGSLTQEANAPLNIQSANFTALNGGDIVLLGPDNEVDFGSSDARNLSVQLVDGSVVNGLSADGNLLIQSDGSLTIGNVSSVGGSVIVNAGGSIEGVSGVVTAAGTIILNAGDEIDGVTLADQSIVSATATTGDISLAGAGDLILQSINTESGGISVNTAGDLLVGSVNSAATININSSGSINDFQDDLLADFTAEGLVTLVAVDEIGGGTASTNVDPVGQLEFSSGTLTFQSENGAIAVGGDGPLVFGDITTPDNLILNSPDSLTIGNVMALGAALSAVNDVTVGSVTTVNETAVTAGGDIVTGDIMASSTALTATGNITVTNVTADTGDVTLDAGGTLTGDQIISETGLVTLNALQRINVTEATASGDVTYEAGNAVNTGLVVSETGAVAINANGNLSATVVEAATNAILTTPRSDVFSDSVTAGESAQLTSGAFLFTRNVDAPDVALDAGTNQTALRVIADTATITAEIDLRLNDIQVGQLEIAAGDDIFDAGFLDGNRVTTDDLVIRVGNSNDEGTFGGVVLETDVETLTVITEGDSFGNIVIRELDDIVLGDIEAGNGGINIAAGGTISGGSLRTVTQSDNNDIRLIATGDASDIRVDNIDAGNVGDAFLIADDDVVITGGTNQVAADYIFVLARNRSVGQTDGITLSTNVQRADLVAGDIADTSQNRGDIFITDANALNVNFARTLNGTINATANGNLVSNNIQSTGVNVSDAIRLTANGLGSDVVTNRVAVFQQAGGVVLTADDDIRDANTRDNLLVIADNLTLIAENNFDDVFNGINSQSRVRSINATVDSSLVIPDGNLEGVREASILVNNTGQLTINEANLINGLVRVINNNGFLTIADVNLTGTSSDNRVFVQTTGNASDIAVGRINAGLRGAVIIDSADDIFDTDQLDDLFVEGRFLSAISRNGSDDSFDGIILNVDVDSFVSDARLDGEAFVRQVG